MTDFLKQYRKTAGLVSKENEPDTITPTKQTQMYLSQTSAKTPKRPSAVKTKYTAQKQQLNSTNPLGRIDLNKTPTSKASVTPTRLSKAPSSRANIKSQNQPEYEVNEYAEAAPQQSMPFAHHKPSKSSEFRKGSQISAQVLSSQYASVTVKAQQPVKDQVFKPADSNRNANRTVTPVKYQHSRNSVGQPELKQSTSTANKRMSASYGKAAVQAPAHTATPKIQKSGSQFSKAPYARMNSGRARESARVPVEQPKPERQFVSRKQQQKMDEEAEIRALQNAKLMTTKKLFFPEQFNSKKQAQAQAVQPQQKSRKRQTKVASVNLEESTDEPEEVMAKQESEPYRRLVRRDTDLASTKVTSRNQDTSFPDNKSSKSGISNQNSFITAGGRRSRKDRSGLRSQQSTDVASKVQQVSRLQHQSSVLTQQPTLQHQTSMPTPQPSHQVRVIPGSDALSLDIQLEGPMGFSNHAEQAAESQEQAVREINRTFAQAVQETLGQSTGAEETQGQNDIEQQASQYRGALNAFVQKSSFARARTPLSLEEKYGASSQANKARLMNSQNKRNSVTPTYTSMQGNRTPQQAEAAQDDRVSLVKSFTHQKSVPRTVVKTASHKAAAIQEPMSSTMVSQNASALSATRRKSMSGLKPATSMMSRTGFIPTQPLERASESLEKINDAFRQINLQTFDVIQSMKRPSQLEFDAARLLCLFINAFRDSSVAWPDAQFDTWQTIVQFLMNSPSQSKTCLELQNIKKKVLRPHLARISQGTYDELASIRTGFLDHYGVNERAAVAQYSGHSRRSLKAMVNLVLTSISHLVPKTEETENSYENSQESGQEFDQEHALQPTQEEISPVKVIDNTFDCEEITNAEVPKMDIQSVQNYAPKQQNYFAKEEISISHVVPNECQTNHVEEQSMASSRGSAWPSSTTSRLTPFMDKKSDEKHLAPMTQKKLRRDRKRREEPGTEIKRVPYKINIRAESDMFEDISASGLDELDADEEEDVEHLQTYDPDQSVAQSESFNVEVHEIQPSKKSEQQPIQKFTPHTQSKAGLSTDRPSELALPSPVAKPVLAVFEKAVEGSTIVDMDRSGHSGLLKLTRADLYTHLCSPSKVSPSPRGNDCLNIQREKGDHTHDSILDSVSPSIHKPRRDWNVVSPQKLFSPEKASKQLEPLREQAEAEERGADPSIRIDDAEQSPQLNEAESSYLTDELSLQQEDLVPATEIKMQFSPTKLTECFVKQDEKKQSGAFELKAQQISEQFGAQQQSKTVTFDATFMMKLRQKQTESVDSPTQKERKFKEMRDQRLRDIEAKLAKWDD